MFGDAASLVENTFAYHLASPEQKSQLAAGFQLLAESIEKSVPDLQLRRAFARTLLGVDDCITIRDWLRGNVAALLSSSSSEALLSAMWPLLEPLIKQSTFLRIRPQSSLRYAALSWISGRPFFEILTNLLAVEGYMLSGDQRRDLTVENVVDLCEDAFSYFVSHIIGGVVELLSTETFQGKELLIRRLYDLQKLMKYGLGSVSAVRLYEIGFADRVIAEELSSILQPVPSDREELLGVLRHRRHEVTLALDKYPSYFSRKLEDLLD